jgi:hypothetical protein
MNLNSQSKLAAEGEETQKEKEEQETIVLVQFTDSDDANYCQQFSEQFKSIEIDSKNPIVQIGNRFYKGEYINNIGTYLFFEEKPTSCSSSKASNDLDNTNIQEGVASGSTSNTFNYFSKSYKKLVLSRLFVEEKKEREEEKNEKIN